jgi:hypothetical protein
MGIAVHAIVHRDSRAIRRRIYASRSRPWVCPPVESPAENQRPGGGRELQALDGKPLDTPIRPRSGFFSPSAHDLHAKQTPGSGGETRAGCSTGCELRGGTSGVPAWAAPSRGHITHPRVDRVGRIRLAPAEQQFCVRASILSLLLFFANVRDDHFDLIRGHSFVREGMHGFLVFATAGDHVS